MGRFKELVDTEEGMRNFRSKYNIPPHVGVRYAAQGEWYDERKTNEVVIPMIAFIEGGMTIPMGTLTRNYLRYFRLSPTQCAPNMFRVHRICAPKKSGVLPEIQAGRGQDDSVSPPIQ